MQSLEALPFITRSVRALFGARAYRIGPSTIAMRQNPYGSATKDNPAGRRIAMANRDPRHMGLFAAAWSIGYAAAVASTGLDQLILSGFAGPFGVLAAEGEPVLAGQLRPVFHVIEGLARMAGSTSVEARPGAGDRVAALAARSADGRLELWLANLTADEVILDRSDLPVGLDAPVSVLDAKSVQAAEGFRMIDHRREIRLGAYAVARTG